MPPVTSKNLNQPTKKHQPIVEPTPKKKLHGGPQIPETPVFVGFLRSGKKTSIDGSERNGSNRTEVFYILLWLKGRVRLMWEYWPGNLSFVCLGVLGCGVFIWPAGFLGQPPKKRMVCLENG